MELTRRRPCAPGSLVIRVFIHFTPTFASWLNQVKRWFATLTEKQIRRGTHRSTRQLEDAIRRYLDIYNAESQPFIWTKSADDIMASIEPFCLRTSKDTGLSERAIYLSRFYV
jgi:hypothetical protein